MVQSCHEQLGRLCTATTLRGTIQVDCHYEGYALRVVPCSACTTVGDSFERELTEVTGKLENHNYKKGRILGTKVEGTKREFSQGLE